MNTFKDRDMQSVIGWVLRIGVYLSIGFVVFGGIFYLYRHGHSIANHSAFKGVPDFISTGSGIIQGVITFKGQAIIQAGIILLIATPIIRVACSAVGFILEKDYLYTCITLLVLLIIFISLFSGHVG